MRGKDSKCCHLDEHLIKVVTHVVGPNQNMLLPHSCYLNTWESLRKQKLSFFPPLRLLGFTILKYVLMGKNVLGTPHSQPQGTQSHPYRKPQIP